ncbi:MAG: hypothetical protein JKY94_16630, partial [Rhodobacteraceae bacterium]|nr:hypothetical protein [Paracoccaceae bacterium]
KPGFWKGSQTPLFKKLRDAIKTRPYQQPMVSFLGARDYALDYDDMRMGKTLVSLAALIARGCQRILCVVPGFARMVWVCEALQWLGASHVVLSGRKGSKGWTWNPKTNRRVWVHTEENLHDTIDTCDITIVNYDILQAQVSKDWRGRICFDADLMGQCGTLVPHWWDGGIIDETHLAKNWRKPKSGMARHDLIATFTSPAQCPILYGLTGTPLTGRVAEYWAQLKLLGGGEIYGKKPWLFHTRYCAGEMKKKFFMKGREEQSIEYWDADGSSNEGELRERLARVTWGRKRCEVSDSMPAITRQLLQVAMEDSKVNVPRPPKKGGKKAAASRVAAYAAHNIRIVGPRGVQETLRSCEVGHKICMFTRYHESRESVTRMVQDAIRKRTYDLSGDFRLFQIHGKINADTRVGLCKMVVAHQGPCLVIANMDSMPGGVSLKGVTENHYLEPHAKLDTIFQSEARAAEEGADPITSLFYAVPGSYSWDAYQKLLPKLQVMDKIANDSDARDLMRQLQVEYEKDLEDILDGFLTAVKPGMLDADGESGE